MQLHIYVLAGGCGNVELRIDFNGEVAQMDHLVLHPFGLLSIESKSVSDGVQITDDGQWMRWFNKKPSGMASPITQAQLQGKLLKELLENTVKQKGFFDQIRLDVLVAISDGGTVTWPRSGSCPTGLLKSSAATPAAKALTPDAVRQPIDSCFAQRCGARQRLGCQRFFKP